MPLYLPPSKAAPPPPPVVTRDRLAVAVGTAGWLVALAVVLLVPALRSAEGGRWVWTCLTGVVLGFVGWAYLARRDRRR